MDDPGEMVAAGRRTSGDVVPEMLGGDRHESAPQESEQLNDVVYKVMCSSCSTFVSFFLYTIVIFCCFA